MLWREQSPDPVWVRPCPGRVRSKLMPGPIAFDQSMKWTGSVRRIENSTQSKWIWTGLDCKITYLKDSGLDWIGNLPFAYFMLEDKLLFS